MNAAGGVGLWALVLVIAWPVLLCAGLAVLEWLESWMVQPSERAAEVVRLIIEMDEEQELERAVAVLLASAVPEQRHEGPHGHLGEGVQPDQLIVGAVSSEE